MSIEWGGLPFQSSMTNEVIDLGQVPHNVLDANEPFQVQVKWSVPAPLAPYLGGSFRLRAFAESIGPGPEQQIGATVVVAVVPGQVGYEATINVPGDTLPGEGAGAPAVSGVYKIVSVLQHLNGGATEGSGFAEGKRIQLRQP